MSSRYLLPCTCGKTIAVTPHQAGGSVSCECGKSHDVPSLRGLRQLEVESTEPEAPAAWGARKGFATFCLAFAVVLGVTGGAVWRYADSVSPPGEEYYLREYQKWLETATPSDTYVSWMTMRDQELIYDERSDYAKEVSHAVLLKRIAYTAWALAGLFLAGMVTAMLWPSSATRPSRSPATPMSRS